MAFLYDVPLQEFGKRAKVQVTVPNHITDNLKPGFGQRPYQIEAFQRFILCYSEYFTAKPKRPFHLVCNMATGSGKTLIMAGLMLHLYQKGYRNFLFFVNRNNIIQKTKDNFLNSQASKYVFNDKIVIDGKEVLIKEIDNFEEADNQNANAQQPHTSPGRSSHSTSQNLGKSESLHLYDRQTIRTKAKYRTEH